MSQEILDKEEYERLFKAYYAKLYYFALDFVSDEDIAQDLVMDVFTAVWNKRQSLKTDGIAAYLYTGVRNAAITYMRRSHHDSRLDDIISLTDFADDSSYEAMEERISEVEKEIGKMPPRTQFVLKECYYNKHTYKEVGDLLGISPNGIKKHIVKGLALLREHFNAKKNK